MTPLTRFQLIYHFIKHGDQRCGVCNEGLLAYSVWKRERLRDINRSVTA